MRQGIILGTIAGLMLLTGTATAQATPVLPCAGGGSIAAEFFTTIVSMRTGSGYSVTVIGLDGFDPVVGLATGFGFSDLKQLELCNDDDLSVDDNYGVFLPTTGDIIVSDLSAHLDFSLSDPSGFQNVTMVVGSADGRSGQFVVLVEGMQVTTADNAGDPFAVGITTAMQRSQVPLGVYAIAETNSLDPLLYLSDDSLKVIQQDGRDVACDDAGSSKRCYGESESLSGYGVKVSGTVIPGGELDAYLALTLQDLELAESTGDNYLQYVVTSTNRRTTGPYMLVIHAGYKSRTPDA